MENLRVALIGAGSRSFGPGTVNDVLISDVLARADTTLVLMDKVADAMADVKAFADSLCAKLGRSAMIETTTDLREALDGTHFVVTAIEVDRYRYWAQDFHIPRKYGFKQVYGENGGPGGLFHALRNMGPMVEIARTMEELCPDATLLNFTNPEHKVCEALTRLTGIRNVGLCHGFYIGLGQIALLLDMSPDDIDASASGINHCTWFQSIRDKKTGEDLYPRLREVEREGDWLAHWHEIALGRVLFRRFGLWPSPGVNHYGEYIHWAEEFVASELQYFYDPVDGHPWDTNDIPDLIYSLAGDPTDRPWRPAPPPEPKEMDGSFEGEKGEVVPGYSGELAVPIMEALGFSEERDLPAINVANHGAIPNLPDDMVVEIPATADGTGLHRCTVEPLPEGIAALLRVQGSIQKLLVEAFAERSKNKLLQAVLIDPTVNSYRRAVEFVDEMLALQSDLLPKFE